LTGAAPAGEEPKLRPKTGKAPLALHRGDEPRGELQEPDNLALFYHSIQRQPHLLTSIPGMISGIEHQIISTIKTIRNIYLKEIATVTRSHSNVALTRIKKCALHVLCEPEPVVRQANFASLVR
jgi:hypothetical protein